MIELLRKDERVDKRKCMEYRKTEVEKNPIEKAEGSARVKMGDTDVIVGVKLGIGEPFPDTPDEGVIMVNSELSPMASSDFELGPPGEESIELARVVDRGIRESKALDMKKLCITEKEKVWMVFVDIQVINHGGNMIDASALAAVTALHEAKFPEYDGEKIDYETKTKKKIPMNLKPIAVTISKINDRLIVDASREEEEISNGRLTVTTTEKGNVCAMQKGGPEAFTVEEIEKCIEISLQKGEELRKLL